MKKAIKTIFIIILLLVALISTYKVFTTLYAYRQADKIYGDLREKKEISKENMTGGTDLSDINRDYVCWINIENTNIDYPVVQCKDNSYYLHRDIYGNYLYSGTIFIDYRCDYNKSKNLIIYGHNMKNNTIFSEIERFKEKDFFYSNSKITLTDKYKASEYEVFAVILVKKDFDYRVCDFENQDDYQKYLNKIINKSIYKSKNTPTVDDRIITLTTCSYEFDNARTVVFAKQK